MGSIDGAHWHFRCAWHAVDGHFDPGPGKPARGGFAAKCEVLGCQNRGLIYWYRGAKFAELPQPVTDLSIAYG